MSRGRNWDRVRAEKRATHAPLQTGSQYLAAHKPLTRKQAKFIRQLRAELDDDTATMPKTCREGASVIDRLLNQKRVLDRKTRELDCEFDSRFGRAA